jgi:5,10-methylene-tetrahydrofolate dehydrogenase/methenyl tetrahydrofolate cyclohydrolase
VIIDGKKIAEEIQEELKVVVHTYTNTGKRRPKLVAILVGDHPSSKAYVGRKMKAAKAIGNFGFYVQFKCFYHQAQILILILLMIRNRELYHPSRRKHIANRATEGD